MNEANSMPQIEDLVKLYREATQNGQKVTAAAAENAIMATADAQAAIAKAAVLAKLASAAG